jgi:hypothetical protein
LLGFLGLVIGIQLIRPARTNPPVDQSHTLEAVVLVPPQVESILQRACYDCHSDVTRWPWYSNVAPASWLLVNHVNEGRRQLNFSEWLRSDTRNPREFTQQRFHSLCRQAETRAMPLTSYLLLHPSARPSPADVETLCQWTNTGLLPN